MKRAVHMPTRRHARTASRGPATGTVRAASAALLVVAVGLPAGGLAGCSRTPAGPPPVAQLSPTVSPAAAPSASSTPTPSATAGSPSGAPRSTPGTPPADQALRLGATGAEVAALQRRLVALGYWLGAVDGTFGSATMHAVTAFQKAAGLAPDGVAGPATMRALGSAARPSPRSGSGRVVEVDLRRQLVLLVRDGAVQWVMDTSTGAVPGTTPTGRYTVFRQVDGYDTGPLGVLYRPKYFVGGVAVHGYPSVPPYPASHGCVRVTNAAMDWIWANAAMPVGQAVWVY